MMAVLNKLQFRMAEIVFWPRLVLASAWKDGRARQRRYRGAAFVLFLGTLGFGSMFGLAVSDKTTFSLNSEPSLSLTVGSWLLLIWLLFTGYVVVIGILIEIISWIRR